MHNKMSDVYGGISKYFEVQLFLLHESCLIFYYFISGMTLSFSVCNFAFTCNFTGHVTWTI